MAWCPDPLFLREQSFKSPSKHTQTPRRGSEMNETLFLIYYLNPNASRFYFILKEELCLYKTVHIKSSQGNRISVCFVILMWQFRFRITAIKFSNTMFEVTLWTLFSYNRLERQTNGNCYFLFHILPLKWETWGCMKWWNWLYVGSTADGEGNNSRKWRKYFSPSHTNNTRCGLFKVFIVFSLYI